MYHEGVAILEAGNDYERRLTLARSGNLVFFWLACWMVFLWGRRTLGATGAVLAVLFFTMIPTVLAHAWLPRIWASPHVSLPPLTPCCG
jgi:hypothetical protein